MESNMYMDFGGAPQSNFATILEQIASEDIMFQLEGVSSLRNQLAMASESSLHKFPQETFCQKLVTLIKQPALMEISNEIKLMAIQCVVNIMDIYPHHVPFLVSLGISAVMRETMEQSMGFIDLVEQCIKCCEKVSQESPRDCLKHGILPIALNMIDFFDKSTQTKILQLLTNVSSSCDSVQDFQDNFLPVIPNICQMLSQGVQSEDDRAKTDKITIVLSKLSASFPRLAADHQLTSSLFEQLSSAGVHETCLIALKQYSTSTSSEFQQSQNTVMINTTSAKQAYSEQSITNILKVLSRSCQYSHLIAMQLISAGIFEAIELLLSQQHEETQIVAEVLLLCQNILPSSDCPEHLQKLEGYKREYFLQQSTQLHKKIARSLLPKIFLAYGQQINTDFRTKCLTLIQQLLSVIPQALLKESFDPATFTKFLHMILRTHQPQQVLCCLKTVLQLLKSQYGTLLAVFFVRHGIQDTIKEYTTEAKIDELNSINQNEDNELTLQRSHIMSFAENEKQRIAMRLQDMKMIMDSLEDGTRKEELKKLVARHDQSLQALHIKQSDIETVNMKDQNKVGSQISEVASEIVEKFFDNWESSSQDFQLFESVQKLAQQIKEEACSTSLNQCEALMGQLAQFLTADQGITSYEFEKSGLLHAIQCMLTMSPTEARNSVDTKYEESKDIMSDNKVGKAEAACYVMRLKAFVDAMCLKIKDRLPFKQLLALCHEQLTLSEPLIFKDLNTDYHGQVEAMHHLSRSVIINLVYEPEKPILSKVQSLPFDHLQASDKKSLVYLKRSQLYDTLKEVPLNIQQSDNFMILEDFLLKRVRTKEDVDKLISQTQKHLGKFNKETEPSKVIVSPEIESFYQKCMERMSDFIDEVTDHESFMEMSEGFTSEIIDYVKQWESEAEKKLPETFWKTWIDSSIALIRQIVLEGNEDGGSDQEDEIEHLMSEVEVKTQAFTQLIKKIKRGLKNDVSMENIADEVPEDEDDQESIEDEVDQSEDVEMTEEQPDDNDNNNSDAEMSDMPSEPLPQNPLQKTEDLSIEDLLKSYDDIEILFFYKGKQIDKNTSFYEICKEPQDAPNEKKDDKLKQLMLYMGRFDCRSITFQIRDRRPTCNLQRKDSLLEFSQIRQRTKSQVVQDISSSTGINEIVQDLLAQFNGLKPTQTIEQTLRLMKLLFFVYSNTEMFTSQGINFLLSTQMKFRGDDFSVQTLSAQQVQFLHPKLDSNLQKCIQDPYKLVQGGLNETLKQIFSECTYLFSFDTKMMYLRLVSFISIDMNRSLYYLRQHLKRYGLKQNKDQRVRQCEKQKVKIDRSKSFVDQTLKVLKEIRKRSMLEVVYKDEEGTGLGPTLEFYSQLGQELRGDKQMWRTGVIDGSLYPRSLQIQEGNHDEVKRICDRFQLAGAFVARSIFDNRMIELPISQVMWDLIFKQKKNLFDLRKLDTSMFNLFEKLQSMANSQQKCSVEAYGLSFYDPSDDTIELIKDGKNIQVTQDNLQTYIDLVLDSTFNESIRLQLQAFKKGFSSVMPTDFLKIFNTKDELEQLICGESQQQADQWTNFTLLQESINTAHGYHQQSKSFMDFLRYIAELKPQQRSPFIQFMTGSPRLPIGGFIGLEPRLTVVLKKPANQNEKSDQILPSVMTCQNYVKMPEYSSYEVLKERFDLAIKEGANNFTLS